MINAHNMHFGMPAIAGMALMGVISYGFLDGQGLPNSGEDAIRYARMFLTYGGSRLEILNNNWHCVKHDYAVKGVRCFFAYESIARCSAEITIRHNHELYTATAFVIIERVEGGYAFNFGLDYSPKEFDGLSHDGLAKIESLAAFMAAAANE
jgi:hypothetical protein